LKKNLTENNFIDSKGDVDEPNRIISFDAKRKFICNLYLKGVPASDFIKGHSLKTAKRGILDSTSNGINVLIRNVCFKKYNTRRFAGTGVLKPMLFKNKGKGGTFFLVVVNGSRCFTRKILLPMILYHMYVTDFQVLIRK